jgi:hypothetical protein
VYGQTGACVNIVMHCCQESQAKKDGGTIFMKFKGFDDWIEIFRGGKQTDSQGREHDGDALIAQAVETLNLDV